ncbi:hypothetical protein VTO73DRAFT_7888 [Trametes versicolor]
MVAPSIAPHLLDNSAALGGFINIKFFILFYQGAFTSFLRLFLVFPSSLYMVSKIGFTQVADPWHLPAQYSSPRGSLRESKSGVPSMISRPVRDSSRDQSRGGPPACH